MNDQRSIDTYLWPPSQIGVAVRLIAQSVFGRSERSGDLPPPPMGAGQEHVMWRYLEFVAGNMNLEAVGVDLTYRNVPAILQSGAPAILQFSGSCGPNYLVVVAGGKRKLTVLGHDEVRSSLSNHAVIGVLRSKVEDDVAAREQIDGVLEQTGLKGHQREAARRLLFAEIHGDQPVCKCWLLRPAAGAPWRTLFRESHLPRLLASFAALHFVQYTIWIGAWWLLGWMSVAGRFESSLFYAWMLLLFAMVPFRMYGEVLGGTLAIRAGTMLKRRLLAGACQLESQEVRQWGIGQLLGRVIESEAVEALSISGGFLVLTGLVESLPTVFVLASGAAGWLHVGLFGLVIAAGSVMATHLYRRQLLWNQQRLELTNDMVEQMIGHRTRLAQQSPEQWNSGEDQELEHYLATSVQVDRQAAWLTAVVPRGWLVLGIAGMAPSFVSGETSLASLAVSLGGVILAYRVLGELTEGGLRLSSAMIAWKRIQFLVKAAARREPSGRPQAMLIQPVEGRPVVTARDVGFRYSGRSQPALQGVDLSIAPGDRLLLTGSSGGGKSTLASLLAGTRVPESGLLLLHGLDRETMGAVNWRRRVVIAPQFQENHVLMGPLSFNLLMGRHWPPTVADLDEAERVCRDLGLGPLLDRMPGGISQLVGETGWQLSHGEKSRVYMARAILQRADLTILDESFGALDPQNLQRTLTYVLAETRTLLVIAHP